MHELIICDATTDDFQRIVSINQAQEDKTSHMNAQQLAVLHELSCYHRVATVNNEIIGFLLAMSHTASYSNANFAWFCSHTASFVYIDRIVIEKPFAGMGVGTALYNDLFSDCRRQQISHVVCEYNLQPLNIASQKFHKARHFKEVGQHSPSEGKWVSLQSAFVS
ncbi:GNAT family N-acetyltransferase [Eionea flava]